MGTLIHEDGLGVLTLDELEIKRRQKLFNDVREGKLPAWKTLYKEYGMKRWYDSGMWYDIELRLREAGQI